MSYCYFCGNDKSLKIHDCANISYANSAIDFLCAKCVALSPNLKEVLTRITGTQHFAFIYYSKYCIRLNIKSVIYDIFDNTTTIYYAQYKSESDIICTLDGFPINPSNVSNKISTIITFS